MARSDAWRSWCKVFFIFCASLKQTEIQWHSLVKLTEIMFRESAFITFRNLRTRKWIWWIYLSCKQSYFGNVLPFYGILLVSTALWVTHNNDNDRKYYNAFSYNSIDVEKAIYVVTVIPNQHFQRLSMCCCSGKVTVILTPIYNAP